MPATAKTQKSRNPFIAKGVQKYGKSAMYRQRGDFKTVQFRKAQTAAVATAVVKKEDHTPIKKVGKTGKEYIVYKGEAAPVLYVRTGATKKVKHPKIGALRASITPGTVLILLAGHFRGKRFVFLKRLESGLLLVSGPFKINGVPIRRVNQAYVIATSTKVDISSVKVPEHINDAYFKKVYEERKPKSEAEFFDKEKKVEKKAVAAHSAADQKDVDAQLAPIIEKVNTLREYLGARFSLTGLIPHQVKF